MRETNRLGARDRGYNPARRVDLIAIDASRMHYALVYGQDGPVEKRWRKD